MIYAFCACADDCGNIKYKSMTTAAPSKKQNKTILYFYIFALILISLLAYANSYQGVFLLDDQIRIVENEAIHDFSWPWKFLDNVRRPMLHFTLALNYKMGGENPFGYHFFNLAVHLIAGLALFGIIRQTCLLPGHRAYFGREINPFAFMVSVLWLVHPLQTQSVTYVIQRAESMMGMFFFLGLYAAIRYFRNSRVLWAVAAGIASLLSGLTKEVAVVLPIIILFYDRAFISSSWKKCLKKNNVIYFGLSITWLAMGYLLMTAHPVEVAPSAGIGYKGITSWQYALNQPRVILHYLRLAAWPHPLVFDYGWLPAENVGEMIAPLLAVLCLIGIFISFYKHYPVTGFLGISFFIVLMPSSSFIPLKDLAFEQRMYLSLAPFLALVSSGIFTVLKKVTKEGASRKALLLICVFGLSGVLGFLTFQRNKDYHSGLVMWQDTAEKRPLNPRALNNYGLYLFNKGETKRAMALFRKSLQFNPDAKAHTDFGSYLLKEGKTEEGLAYLQKAITLDDGYADAYMNVGAALAGRKRLAQAIPYYLKVIALEPDYAAAYNNLGAVLADLGRYQEAITYYQKAIKLGFERGGVYHNLGVASAMTGKPYEAIEAIEQALRLRPDLEQARRHLVEIQAKLADETSQ